MAETIIMPKLGFDMAEGTLVRWVRAEGEQVQKGEVLAEIETDKATVEVESSASGTVLRTLADQGDVVPVSTPIAIIGEPGEQVDEPTAPAAAGEEGAAQPATPPAEAREAASRPARAEGGAPEAGFIKASPLARRIARERQVDLGAVEGTGPGGRIVRRDIEAALSGERELKPTAAPKPRLEAQPSDERLPLTRLRQAIGRRMVEAKQQVPHFYVTREVRMGALMEMRARANAALPEGEKLSVNDFLVKAVALALREFPNLNASLDGEQVLRHGSVNVGNAVAVEGGLLTVVCRDADRKPLRQISREVRAMAERVRSGKVRPEDIEGSTFSISNLGMFEVEDFIAIINPPEAAILAVGSALEVPVVEDGEVRPGWRMKATISVDHRISDGAEAARFMQSLAGYLEEPVRLML